MRRGEHFQITASQLAVYNSCPGVERGFYGKCGTGGFYLEAIRNAGEPSDMHFNRISAPTGTY
jgi:hypothetical protein